MPLSLTCDCGARFEVEDALAGQAVGCPECQQTVKAGALARPTKRTSVLALASLVLACVGAFTVVGTIAAAVLGVIAVVQILRDSQRLGGLVLAGLGIGLSVPLTAVTLVAIVQLEAFSSFRRETMMADQQDDKVDSKTPLTVKESGFSISKPARWHQAKKGFQYFPVQPLLHADAKLLLDQPEFNAFVDVQIDAGGPFGDIDAYLLGEMTPQGAEDPDAQDEAPGQLQPHKKDDVFGRLGKPSRDESKDLGKIDGFSQHELIVEQKLDGKSWKFLIRTFQKGGKLYIVRGFTEAARFASVEKELREIVDSFKVTPDS